MHGLTHLYNILAQLNSIR